MIMPMYRGTARHMESWMRRDIWVTRYKPQEIGFQFIERYANNESIANEDIVIWMVTSSLHIARDEDGMVYRRQGQPARFVGAAVTMWVGFDMKPHNLMRQHAVLPGVQVTDARSQAGRPSQNCRRLNRCSRLGRPASALPAAAIRPSGSRARTPSASGPKSR